ncbi:MAG: glycine oxidase ThiO [Gammaproteobacteria bacterium]
MPNKLNKHFDVLVVGGGIIGMLTAQKLLDEKLKVALIEKDELGGKATWAAGGILSPLNPWQLDVTAQLLADEGRYNFPALADELKQETAIDIELLQSGMLILDINEKQQALKWAKDNNETVEILSHIDLLKFEPNLSNNIKEALYVPDVQQVRPPKLIAALKKYLQQQKIDILEHTAVEKVLIESNQAVGITTKNYNFHAERIIICNGAWANDLFPTASNMDIHPIRGQMLLYRPPEKILTRIVLKEKSYLIPRQDGHILCGSTIEDAGFENKITQAARRSLQNIANELAPVLSKLTPIKQWSALRPGTNRVVPYICEHPSIAGLYLNSGHYRYGIIMSLASARLMTKLITNSLNRSQISVFT